MDARILIGTESGLWHLRDDALEPIESFTARTVTALASRRPETWAVVDGSALWQQAGHEWTERVAFDDRQATCVAATADGLLIGTAEAHLVRLRGDTAEPVDSFDRVDGRQDWHTP